MNIYGFTESERAALLRGEQVRVGKHTYKVCPECRKIVCMTKWLLGSAHLCVAPDGDPEIPGA